MHFTIYSKRAMCWMQIGVGGLGVCVRNARVARFQETENG